MARTSSTTARAAGGTRTRRTKAQGGKPDGLGAAGLPGGADLPEPALGDAGAAFPCAAAVEEGGASVGAAGDSAQGAAGVSGNSATTGVALPAGLRLWLARARGLRLTMPQVVFELHVRQGLPLLEVARVLGLGPESVRELWGQSRAARAALAPQSESDFALVREHISAALWQTVEATFPDVLRDAEDEDADPPAAATPPMLSVRLKALDQIAKLYDLSVEQRPAAFAPLPYATPDDIADDVRLRVLEMHRRGE